MTRTTQNMQKRSNPSRSRSWSSFNLLFQAFSPSGWNLVQTASFTKPRKTTHHQQCSRECCSCSINAPPPIHTTVGPLVREPQIYHSNDAIRCRSAKGRRHACKFFCIYLHCPCNRI